MGTEKQIRANRKKAQKATDPPTADVSNGFEFSPRSKNYTPRTHFLPRRVPRPALGNIHVLKRKVDPGK